MDTWKLPLCVFTLLFASLVISSGVYCEPSDVIIEYPTVFMTGENDSVITFDSVRNELSADGEWIKVNQNEIDSASITDGSAEFDDDINTEYVWRPNNVDENWSPYTNGYWTYTNCGWMWVSYYNWGWRPYHYGRWWWSSRWGWVWSPGYIWAPAWVVWMFYDGYCGWYPLSPRVRWHHHHHHHGYYCSHIRFRVRHWAFVHYKNFLSTPINHTVIIDPYQNGEILKRSKFESNIEYANGIVTNKGPELKEIEKSAGKKIVTEDVTKFNTTKRVNEYVKRSSEETTEIEKKTNETQPYQEIHENNSKNEKPIKKEEQSKEQNKNNNRSNNDTETPKKETPKQETPKQETPKQETPRQETPKQETPRQEAPKQEAPRQEKKNESPPQKNESNEKNNNSKQNNEKPNESFKNERK